MKTVACDFCIIASNFGGNRQAQIYFYFSVRNVKKLLLSNVCCTVIFIFIFWLSRNGTKKCGALMQQKLINIYLEIHVTTNHHKNVLILFLKTWKRKVFCKNMCRDNYGSCPVSSHETFLQNKYVSIDLKWTWSMTMH